MEQRWFNRVLAWIDGAITFTLMSLMVVLFVLFATSLVEQRSVETFISSLLYSGMR